MYQRDEVSSSHIRMHNGTKLETLINSKKADLVLF